MNTELKELVGRTMKSVENKGNQELLFTDVNGDVFMFYHEQD